MIPPQFRDPREPATGLRFSVALAGACALTADLLTAAGRADRQAAPSLLGRLFAVIASAPSC